MGSNPVKLADGSIVEKNIAVNSSGEYTDTGNGAPVNTTDVTGNQALISTFGDAIVGVRHPSFAAQFVYGLFMGATNPYENAATVEELNGGTVSVVNGELLLQTGTNVAGKATIQSNEYVEYLPGHELYALFTAIAVDIVADRRYRFGVFDSSNGFFVEIYNGNNLFVRRKLGTDYTQNIELSEIFTDGIFDFEKFNILMLRYGYLGVAPIKLSAVKSGGGFGNISTIEYPNKNTEIHTAQTYLPLRAEVENIGATTNGTIKVGSISAGVVNGGDVRVSSRKIAARLKKTIASPYSLLGVFRNKTTFAGIENRIKARLFRASGSSDGTKSVSIIIYRNPPITNTPTWTDVRADFSVMEYSTDATIDLATIEETGNMILPFELGKVDSFAEHLSDMRHELRAGEWAGIVAFSDGASDVTFSMNWEDRF